MSLNDFLSDGEPQSGSFFFARKERLENSGVILRGKSLSIIANGDFKVRSDCLQADRDLSIPINCVSRIRQQIEKHPAKFLLVNGSQQWP